jgi:hypothetical protein
MLGNKGKMKKKIPPTNPPKIRRANSSLLFVHFVYKIKKAFTIGASATALVSRQSIPIEQSFLAEGIKNKILK